MSALEQLRGPVLVVDDDDALRETIADALEPLELEVDTAATATEARERIERSGLGLCGGRDRPL